MKKTVDVIADSQIMTLTSLQNIKSYQVKLGDKGSAYDYVTVTDSIEGDVKHHSHKDLVYIYIYIYI